MLPARESSLVGVIFPKTGQLKVELQHRARIMQEIGIESQSSPSGRCLAMLSCVENEVVKLRG
jgi:hypothetical protein